MKRFLFCIVFIILFNTTNTIAIEQDKVNLNLYNYYFIIKELCKTPVYAYFIDYNKVKNAQITCCQCNHTINSIYLWAHSILNTHEQLLKKFIHLASNGSIEEITLFFLATYQELQIPCDICKKYSGYYIPEQQSSSQP